MTRLDDDGILNDLYLKGDCKLVTEMARYPLSSVPEMLREEVAGEDGVMWPRYQLRCWGGDCWSGGRKSRFIESFLVNAPVPPICLYEVAPARYEVIDGYLRLTVLDDFYGDRFALVGLRCWPRLDGRRYSELPETIRLGIDRRYLSANVILNETTADEGMADFIKRLVRCGLNT